MSKVTHPTSAVLIGLLLAITGFVVALLAIVVALMFAAGIMGDHAPRTP